jgi:hypothetical protein
MYKPTVVTATISLPSGQGGGVSAVCPSGTVAVGGGAESMTKLPAGLTLLASNPVYTAGNPPTGWYANATNTTSNPLVLTSYAICMQTTPTT